MVRERDSVLAGPERPDNGEESQGNAGEEAQAQSPDSSTFKVKGLSLETGHGWNTEYEINFVRGLGKHSGEGPQVGKRVLLERYKAALLNKRSVFLFSPNEVLKVVDEELRGFRHIWKENRI